MSLSADVRDGGIGDVTFLGEDPGEGTQKGLRDSGEGPLPNTGSQALCAPR